MSNLIHTVLMTNTMPMAKLIRIKFIVLQF